MDRREGGGAKARPEIGDIPGVRHQAIAVSARPQKPVSFQVVKAITVTGTLSESSRNKESEWGIEIQISTLTTGTVRRISDGGNFGGQQHKCLPELQRKETAMRAANDSYRRFQ